MCLALLFETQVGGAASAPPSNDNATGKLALDFGVPRTTSTVLAGTGTGDPVTTAGEGTCDGEVMGKTVWYYLTGDGYRVTVTTAGSDFDTLLTLYRGSRGFLDFMGCSNDVSPSDATSSFSFDSIAGHLYNIEVGGLDANGTAAPPPTAGNLKITAFSAAPAQAVPVVTTTTPAVVTTVPVMPTVQRPAQLSVGRPSLTEERHGKGILVHHLRLFVPHDARARVSCVPRNRCRSFDRTAAHATGPARQRITVRTLEHTVLRSGTLVRIYVTRPHATGWYTSYSVSKGDAVRNDVFCLAPGSLTPHPCA